MTQLLQLIPEYRDYVWGGQRLRPGTLTAEAWIVYEGDRIANGPLAGRTLSEAAETLGADLLGRTVVSKTDRRFPLLIKILDCNAWLSIQVHPNDAQAVELEGPGHFGKTEAWHVLDAADGATLIAGVQSGTSPDTLAQAIRAGTILDHVQSHAAHAGDTVFMPAGTLHALGPGLLIYEVQQTSNITYRIFDWNRPASAGRALHLEQSVAVTDAHATGQMQPKPDLADHDRQRLIACPYFTLDVLAAQHAALSLDTRGESFNALTVIEGQGEVIAGDEHATLKLFDTVLIAANTGAYQFRPIDSGGVRALVAGVG